VQALDRMRERKVSPGVVHMANSAAVVSRPDTWMDMVRPGAILYGYHQNYNRRRCVKKRCAGFPPGSSELSGARRGDQGRCPGAGIGYNARFRAPQASRVAIISAGYADGCRAA